MRCLENRGRKHFFVHLILFKVLLRHTRLTQSRKYLRKKNRLLWLVVTHKNHSSCEKENAPKENILIKEKKNTSHPARPPSELSAGFYIAIIVLMKSDNDRSSSCNIKKPAYYSSQQTCFSHKTSCSRGAVMSQLSSIDI